MPVHDPPQPAPTPAPRPDVDAALARQQARRFQAFERLDASRPDIPGASVGLVLNKRITGLTGGQIGLHSAVGQGSTFWLLQRCPAPVAAPTP